MPAAAQEHLHLASTEMAVLHDGQTSARWMGDRSATRPASAGPDGLDACHGARAAATCALVTCVQPQRRSAPITTSSPPFTSAADLITPITIASVARSLDTGAGRRPDWSSSVMAWTAAFVADGQP